MKFEMISSERLSDKVVKEIVIMIETGVLKPGDKIPAEDKFAKKIGVSRGILREALNILQIKGYISRKPGNGTFIRELPPEVNENYVERLKRATYNELIEAREFLEHKIIDLVIERASDKEINKLEKYLDDTKMISKKYNFHIKMAELCQNIIIYNFMLIYYDLMKEMKIESTKNSNRNLEIPKEHGEILYYIKLRDKEKAKIELSNHFKLFRQSLKLKEE